ncbi:MAG: tagaturonate epimerase family protein [Bacillota bacterium]
MKEWKQLVKDIVEKNMEDIKNEIESYDIYPDSLRKKEGSLLFMTKIENQKKLIIVKEGLLFNQFIGETGKIKGVKIKVAPLSHENAKILRNNFEFTNPVPVGKKGSSLGLGDRIGLAAPGHIETIKDKDITPVLAQQSIRELELTERSYEDVLDAASWGVFEKGYEKGFGADGDHLKNAKEVNMALDLGFSMITLDCSEHIDNSIEDLNKKRIHERYRFARIKENGIEELEERYVGNTFTLQSGTEIKFDKETFQKIILTYYDMLNFAEEIYMDYIKTPGHDIDFELSIDETATPTSPQAHYFIASELDKKGFDINSMAPRFCGEFQKAIDYIGDLDEFEKEFKIHAQIADEFGYKLSIHSGSDKFSVYPIIGEYTNKRVHVKTAGTNWLEALRIIAENDPALFREIQNYALEHFQEATKYYHVTTDLEKIPEVENLSDNELTRLLEQEDARQLLHITYGVIFQAKDDDGNYRFKDRLYEVWNENEEEYSQALQKHIGKHVKDLGF